MIGTKEAWLPGWMPGMVARVRAIASGRRRSLYTVVRRTLRLFPAAERWEERRVATGRYFPGGLPALSTRMAEGIAVAIVALAIKSAPVRTTAELGLILCTICLAVLLVLGAAELRTWWKWSRMAK